MSARPEIPRVAIPFVLTGTADSPNVRWRRREAPSESYFRAMTVCFASLRRWNSDLELTLVTTSRPPDRHAAAFERLGVSIRILPFSHSPPDGFSRRFITSLYMLDALALSAEADTLFLDPDVVCIRPLERMMASLAGAAGAAGALPIDYPPDHDINGLSRRQAGQLHALLGEPADFPVHYGGECYVIPRETWPALSRRAEDGWQLALERFASGDVRFTTEEHILSFALRGVPVRSVESDIRRIWTASRYRTVRGDEADLTFWHLPAEKGRGFDELERDCVDQASWFWTAPRHEYVRRVARAMGLRRRSLVRFSRDSLGQLATRLGR